MKLKNDVDKSQQIKVSICKNPLQTNKVELLATNQNIMNSCNSGSLLNEKWLFTRNEVAEIFGVSLVCLWNWHRKYVIRSLKVGGRTYYTRTAIIEAINNNTLKSDNYENK